MSWQAYVDTSLLSSGQIDAGAIFSVAGDAVWAASPDFRVTLEEVKTIVGAFSDSSSVQTNGFHVDGDKYMYVHHDDRSVMGRRHDYAVIIWVKTKQALIVGRTPPGSHPQAAEKVVEALADYLISLGY
ncbi:profilin [Nonomuraea sp. NPDC049028]|uniref:profilin n=1 Tax=Nonomuraea sp. NPDC049028 TaxID=3364348 RepID=UPI003723C1F7